MDCQICCEKINLSTRKNVICNFCDYSVCRACFQMYVSETTNEPSCMNCKKVLNRVFLNENCTNIFLTTTFKSHRENILLDREKALLPETQPYVVLEKIKIKTIVQASVINDEIRELEKIIYQKK